MVSDQQKNETSSVRLVEIDERSHEQRLDNFLSRELKGVPKSLIYRLIRTGQVRVNRKRAKPLSRLSTGDSVRIPPVKHHSAVTPSNMNSQWLTNHIVFESESLIVVDKPHGLPVHGGSGQSFGLIELLRHRADGSKSLELAHRIDKETSGLVIIAKKRAVLRELHDAFREQQVKKTYLAVLQGRLPKKSVTVDKPLLKRTNNLAHHVVVSREGKASCTVFQRVSYSEDFDVTLVKAMPMTGRTHQIRVHAQSIGLPIVGDPKYNRQSQQPEGLELATKRLCLHAHKLSLVLGGQKYEFVAPMPKVFEEVLKGNELDQKSIDI